MKKVFFLLFIIGFSVSAQRRQKTKEVTVSQPKLIVGIVVDQMRNDYLYRYAAKYSAGGFKRLMNEGFTCKNNHYTYAATYTGPGHAHIFNGSQPALSGIIGNEWFDRGLNQSMYVAEDSTVSTVGSSNVLAGRMSPKNMKVTSICDQLRLSNQFQSRTFGVALKDRGSILPAGHTANAAYWFDTKTGKWITSTYYMAELPKWAAEFNDRKRAEELIAHKWTTLLPMDQYTESEADNQPYENPILGETTTTFPHTVKSITALPTSPFGNTITKEFALSLIQNENLGKGTATDFLTLSFSSPDYVGHSFGTFSVEMEDVYLRLDKDIEDILNALDLQLGAGNYTVFLTADHGAADIPAYLKKNKIPAGLFIGTELKKQFDETIAKEFGPEKWVLAEDNYQIYLNHDLLKAKNMTVSDFFKRLKPLVIKMEGVYQLVDLNDKMTYLMPDATADLIENVNNPKRSGDIMVLLEPAWFSGYAKGTTHGTGWAYDTHVPLIFYGAGITKGITFEKTAITDIAPTIAALLAIQEPNGCVGRVIQQVIAK